MKIIKVALILFLLYFITSLSVSANEAYTMSTIDNKPETKMSLEMLQLLYPNFRYKDIQPTVCTITDEERLLQEKYYVGFGESTIEAKE